MVVGRLRFGPCFKGVDTLKSVSKLRGLLGGAGQFKPAQCLGKMVRTLAFGR